MKTDLKKDRKDLYRPGSTGFVDVVVPPMTYLTVDGHGDPNTSPLYPAALRALYSAAYATKFAHRAQGGLTFNGPHHEIYLSDARRTAAEKLRTVLRQPVRSVPVD